MSLTLGRISFFTFWTKSLPKGRTVENAQGYKAAESRQRKGNGRRLKSKEQGRGGAAENTQGCKAAESRQRKAKRQASGKVRRKAGPSESAEKRRKAGKERKTASEQANRAENKRQGKRGYYAGKLEEYG